MVALPAFAGFPFPSEMDDAPPVPSSGLALWLDAAKGLTLDGATSRVSAWASRAGSAVATQATTAAMPVLAAMNGLSSVRFDGVDDALVGQALASHAALTIFAVFQSGSSLSSGERTYLSTRSASNAGIEMSESSTTAWFRVFNASSQNAVQIACTPAVPCLAVATTTGGVSTCSINGGASSSVPQGPDGSATPVTLGTKTGSSGSQPWDGLLSESLVYGRVLSASEIAKVSAYLKAKWGTP